MKKSILCVVLAVIMSLPLTGCGRFNYSMEEHADRLYELVEQLYISKYHYKDFELYPLYNQNDEFKYFVAEFEPYGFVYIEVDFDAQFEFMLYLRDATEDNNCPWVRYKLDDSNKMKPIGERHENEFVYEEDEDGLVYRYNSHYKEADIKGERRYLIDAVENTIYKIPAVKRGDKWLNLISMEEFSLSDDLQEQAVCIFRFIDTALNKK